MSTNTKHTSTIDDKSPPPTTSSGNRTSGVWDYFTVFEDKKDKKMYSQCNVNKSCEPLTYHKSTTAMLSHLKSYHEEAYQVCIAKRSESSQTTLTSNYKMQSLSQERQNAITTAIARFIGFDGYNKLLA